MFDYEKEMEKALRQKEEYDKRQAVKEIRKEIRPKFNLTTTKIIVLYIFINLTVVEIYSMAIMAFTGNLDALYALITAVITESISFAVYAAKSYNETKQEELISLERDRMSLQTDPDPVDAPDGEEGEG